MVKKNPDQTFDVICETCNGKLSDYLDHRATLPTNATSATELAWYYGFDTSLAKCSYCV